LNKTRNRQTLQQATHSIKVASFDFAACRKHAALCVAAG
jgi:hypothetical protein